MGPCSRAGSCRSTSPSSGRGRGRGARERSGIDKRPVDHPVRLEADGVEGDTVCDTADHGGPFQAVYAYSIDDLDFWAGQLQRPVEPGNVGENLTVAGVDCSHAVVGELWQVGDAVLRVTRAAHALPRVRRLPRRAGHDQAVLRRPPAGLLPGGRAGGRGGGGRPGHGAEPAGRTG